MVRKSGWAGQLRREWMGGSAAQPDPWIEQLERDAGGRDGGGGDETFVFTVNVDVFVEAERLLVRRLCHLAVVPLAGRLQFAHCAQQRADVHKGPI
eukprot:scaffold399_cov112-Isochrysis_galbana.AAC.1